MRHKKAASERAHVRDERLKSRQGTLELSGERIAIRASCNATEQSQRREDGDSRGYERDSAARGHSKEAAATRGRALHSVRELSESTIASDELLSAAAGAASTTTGAMAGAMEY